MDDLQPLEIIHYLIPHVPLFVRICRIFLGYASPWSASCCHGWRGCKSLGGGTELCRFHLGHRFRYAVDSAMALKFATTQLALDFLLKITVL